MFIYNMASCVLVEHTTSRAPESDGIHGEWSARKLTFLQVQGLIVAGRIVEAVGMSVEIVAVLEVLIIGIDAVFVLPRLSDAVLDYVSFSLLLQPGPEVNADICVLAEILRARTCEVSA